MSIDMGEIDRRTPTGGGPSQHAGNIYHYLYAATRVLELLDPEAPARAIHLEGLGTESAEEDIVDVAVDRYEALELIQVRWSQRPENTLQPHEWWEAIGRLWKRGGAITAKGRALELKVNTNRSASPVLQQQKRLWEEWAHLDDSELAGRLEAAWQATAGDEHELWQAVSQAIKSDDNAAIAVVLRSVRLEAGLGDAALDHTQRLLGALLRALAFPPDRWADTIVQHVAELCTPGQAGKPVTADDVARWLELTAAPGMAHDIAPPEAYIPFPTFAEQIDAHVGRLACSGGVLVLIGSPGTGKTVQLAEWAQDKGCPFYACRVDNRDDDIRQRAGQWRFLVDIARGIWDRYPDRVAPRPGIAARGAPAASEEELRTELVGILDTLAANSPEDSPAVIVVDGVDDARRALGSTSFLEIIQRPPPHVVLVISAQGEHFLPDWLRGPGRKVNHVSMPPLPEQVAVKIVRRLLDLGEGTEPQESATPAPEPHSNGDLVERVVRLSAGNVLVLRTICGQLREEQPERRLASLDQLGAQAFAGIEDYFDRLLADPSPATLSFLRALALVRESLTLQQVAEATGQRREDLLAERPGVEFLLAASDSTPPRYRLYHPSLRRFVQDRFFPDREATMHGKLADMAAIAPQGDPLAAELPYHLAGAERWAEVVATINYDFLDRLFDAFSPPSQIREQVDLLVTAAARVGCLAEAVRAMLVAQKVEARTDYLLPPAQASYGADEADFSTIVRVLVVAGQIQAATNLLREVADPEARFRTACLVAQEAFENGREADAQSLFELARATVLFHAPRRDIVAVSGQATCQVWTGTPLATVLTDLISSQWQRPAQYEQPAEILSEEEQLRCRCETVRAVGEATAKAGRQQDLRDAMPGVAEPYLLAAFVGLCEGAERPDPTDADAAITLARQGHAWSDEIRRMAATLAFGVYRDSNAAREIAHLREPLPAAPDLLTGLVGDGGMTPEEFLDLVKLRQRAGLQADFEIGKTQESDRHRTGAAELYYQAGLALVRAEVAHVEGRSDQEVGEVLSAACQAWGRERPYWMNWTSFFDARGSLSKLTPRLALLAFKRNAELGSEVGDTLWSLGGWSVGRLLFGSRLRVLEVLADVSVARSWVVARLKEAIDDIRTHERTTGERTSLLFGAANVARKLGWLDYALSLVREGLRTTKGLPPVEEEPRYYAVLEVADALRKRGRDTVSLLRRLGRLIQLSHEATDRHYAGNTWPWLVGLLAQADLPTAFDLILELDHAVEDEGVPDARSSLHRVLDSAPEVFSGIEWVALLWLVGAEKLDDTKELIETLVNRVDDSKGRVHSDQLLDWAAGALLRDLREKDSERVREAIRSGEPSERQGDPDSVEAAEGLHEVVKDPELLRRAEAGDAEAIHAAMEPIQAWIAAIQDKEKYDPQLQAQTSALQGFLERAIVHCHDTDVPALSQLHERLPRYGTRPQLNLRIAQRLSVTDPARSKELLVAALDEVYPDRSGTLRNAFESLAQLDPEQARRELVERVAFRRRFFDPYWAAVVLCELPDTLVSTDDLAKLMAVLCADLEDSLEVVPPDPVSRKALDEAYSSPDRTACDFLRDLLHNRDNTVRRRAREALGILAHDSAEQVARSVARWDDLETLPAYARLTAIEMRLSVLWAVAELEPTAIASIAADIHDRYVAAGGPYSGHFLIREYGRRICLKALEVDPACLPGGAPARVAAAPRPALLVKPKAPFYRGDASPMFDASGDRHLEYDVETLAWLFRVPTRRAERVIQFVAAKLHRLTEEETARDHWIMEQAYTQKSRPLRPARQELFEHAYRIVQQRWYEHRLADEDNWLERTPADFERRRFDPWLPTLLVRYLEGSGLFGAADQLGDSAWLKLKLEPLDDYVTESDWTLVYESAGESRGARRMASRVELCLIEPALADSWLQGRVYVVKRDLPHYSYLMEILEDFDWWWRRWRYGEDNEAGRRLAAAYAECDLAVEEPFYSYVVVPLGKLREGMMLRRRRGGLNCVAKDSGDVLWRIEWYGGRSIQVWARTSWLFGHLDATRLCLAFERWQRREITEIGSYGVAVAQTGLVREWKSYAALHPDGQWDLSEDIEILRG